MITGLVILVGLLVFGRTTAQVHRISDGNFTGCSGLFVDSGDIEGNYGPNENYTVTLCPDGTTGSYIRLTFSSPDIRPGDMLCFFDGPNILSPSLGCNISFLPGAPFIIQATALNPTGCLTVVFTSNAGAVGKGWNAQISCQPACQVFEANITSMTPAPSPVDTGWIDICPNQSVTVSANALFHQNNLVYAQHDTLCLFEWDFGDGNLVRSQTAENTYKNPGGYNISLTIIDQLGCRNTNFVSQKVRVAPPPKVSIGNLPGPLCYGDTLMLSAADTVGNGAQVKVQPEEGKFDVRKVRADSLPLPDGNGAKYSTSLVFNEFPPDKYLTDPNQILSICANMEHSWMRDLRITLTCPSGKEIVLVNQEETGDEVFLGIPYEDDELLPVPIPGIGWTYCWSHQAPNASWLDYANMFTPKTLPADTYSTYESMSDLIGCPLNGEWVLTIQDLWPIDNGYIFWWDITFDETLLPFVETFKPKITNLRWADQDNIILHKEKEIQAVADEAGEILFRLTYRDDFSCEADTFIVIPVLSPTHPNCFNCLTDLNLTPDTTLCGGEPVQLWASNQGYTGGDITFAHHPRVPIGYSTNPPSNPYYAPIEVENLFPLMLSGGAAEIESVCFTLQTNPVNNIAAYLMAPDGKQIPLVTYKGGMQQDFYKTCFSPQAGSPLNGSPAPFTGTFAAEGNWNTLAGSPINGTWQLLLSDNFGISRMGLFENWQITFRASNETTYAWSPAAGLSCIDCPNPVATAATPSIYQVQVSDAYGCNTSGTVQLGVEPVLDAPMIDCGESTPAGLSIYWNPVPGATGYLINVNKEGWMPTNNPSQYLIGGYQVGDTLNIELKADDSSLMCPSLIGMESCRFFYCQMYAVVEQVNPPSCHGGNDGEVYISAFNGTSPFKYDLNGIQEKPIGFFNNLTAGNHFVVVTDANDCMDTVFFSVGQPAPITFTVQVDSVSCFGGNDGGAIAATSGGTGTINFTWLTTPAVFIPTLSNRTAGTYMLRATDEKNCMRDTVITIPQPAALTVSVTTGAVMCSGNSDGNATAVVQGGTPPYSLQWNDPLNQTGTAASGLAAGSYQLFVTDYKGCSHTASAIIDGPAANAYQVNALPPTCQDGLDGKAWIFVQSANLPVTFQWLDPVAQLSDTLIAPAGFYQVVAIDGNSCRDTLSALIPEQVPILLSVTHTPEVCPGQMAGQASATIISGGTPPYTFTWSGIPGQSGPSVFGLTDGAYRVTVSDGNGCTSYADYQILQAEAVVLSLNSQPASCTGSPDGEATVMTIQGQAPFQYAWSDPAGTTSNILPNVLPGLYTVTVTGSNGCSEVGQVDIGALNAFDLDSVDLSHPACHDTQDGSILLAYSGGVGQINYQWSPTGLPNSAHLSSLAPGSYSVTLTDEAGCFVVRAFELKAPPALVASVTVEDVHCYGNSDGQVVAMASGGTPPYTYQWSGFASGPTGVQTALSAGSYTITVTDKNQCLYTEEASLSEPEELMMYLMTESPNCSDPRSGVIEAEVFGGTLPYEYSLNSGALQPSGIFTFLESGNYYIQVMDARGCMLSQMTTLHQGDAFEIELGEDVTIEQGQSVDLNVDYGDGLELGFLWQAPYQGTLSCTACEVTTASPLYTTTYTLIATDPQGCSTSDQITVFVRPARLVLVPTAFTPNGDGNNDLLIVHGKEGAQILRFQVFNRWGELVFEEFDFPINSRLIGWDGNYRGTQMNSGMYIWTLEVEYIDGFREILSGQSNLIR